MATSLFLSRSQDLWVMLSPEGEGEKGEVRLSGFETR